MELVKNRSSKFKIALISMTLVLVMSSSTSGNDVEYYFVEDFSDSQLDEWTFTGFDFNNQENDTPSGIKVIPHTLLIENEELVYRGNLDIRKQNVASIQGNTAFGGWSFDLYIPSSYDPNSYFNYDISIMMSRSEMGIETLYPTFALNIRKNFLRLRAFNETRIDLLGASKSTSTPNIEFDKLLRFDLIRTVDRFYVFIDKTLVFNRTFSLDLDPFVNYFTIVAGQGSNMRFDNIQITTDATSLLNGVLGNVVSKIDQVLETSSTESITSSQTGSNPPLFSANAVILGVGSSIVALVGGLTVWKRIQKIKLAKLIKISSNGRFPKVSKTISQIFDNKKSLYFLLLGHKTQDMDLIDHKLEATMTYEMQQYRHLLHPFRLSIMQLLYTSTKTSSIEIKERLDLSWSDFYNSVRQLEKKELIRVFDDFDENGLTRQFVIMVEKGAKEYVKFINMIGKFVEFVKNFIPDYDGTDLYP